MRPASRRAGSRGTLSVPCGFHSSPETPLTDLNPQRAQMSDESMVRNLAAQAQAIWPQEREMVRRYGLVFRTPRSISSPAAT